MAEGSMHDRDSILDVMNSCGCTEAQAANLLQHSNNDPEKAKHRHRTLLRFMNLRTGGHSPSPVRPLEKRPPRKPSIPSYTDDFSDHSSDEQVRYDTPRTDDEPFSPFAGVSRNVPDYDNRSRYPPPEGSPRMPSKDIPKYPNRQLPIYDPNEPHRESSRVPSRESLNHPQKVPPYFAPEETIDGGPVESPYVALDRAARVPPRVPPRPTHKEKSKNPPVLTPEESFEEDLRNPNRESFPASPREPRGNIIQPLISPPEDHFNHPLRAQPSPPSQVPSRKSHERQSRASPKVLPSEPNNRSDRTPVTVPPPELPHNPRTAPESPPDFLEEGGRDTSNRSSATTPPQAHDDAYQPSYPVVPANHIASDHHSTTVDSEVPPLIVKERPIIVVEPAPPEPYYSHADDLQSEVLEKFELKPQWDFRLPLIPAPSMLTPGTGQGTDGFNLLDLIGALQQGATEQVISNYLGYYNPNTIRRHINDEVGGFPAMFFATASNNDWILRTWIAHGGNVNAVHNDSKVPLLAFAIIHSETLQAETTHIVATLLSLGASPSVIPKAFYTPYCKDLPDDGPEDDELGNLDTEANEWLTKVVRSRLARTANLTHRYNLERADKTKKPSMRHWQVAVRKNAEALLGLPYFLIGQSMAANRLLQTCLSHLVIPGKRPLVMAFAGPSGHGKTELARRLGYLMSLELEVVDCTIVNREMELFGGRHPYVNADQGTPLNNFLARNSGRRCIVFLDEFEKTTKEIHQALLLPFDNGEYQDRRNLAKVDCSKTIWILATNALDATIQNFCKLNEQAMYNDEDESQKLRLLKRLEKNLKDEFVAKFDAPITGRISAFLPFLLFSPQEQAVIAHKYLLELGREVRNPVSLLPGADERLIGNIRLRIRRDASVCRSIADDGYHIELGARSLIAAVDSVKSLLVDSYLGVDELITEEDGLVDFVVDVNQGELVANMGTKARKDVDGEEGEGVGRV